MKAIEFVVLGNERCRLENEKRCALALSNIYRLTKFYFLSTLENSVVQVSDQGLRTKRLATFFLFAIVLLRPRKIDCRRLP